MRFKKKKKKRCMEDGAENRKQRAKREAAQRKKIFKYINKNKGTGCFVWILCNLHSVHVALCDYTDFFVLMFLCVFLNCTRVSVS